MREDHKSVRDFTNFTISNPASSRTLIQNAVNIERTDIDKYLDQLEEERAHSLAILNDVAKLLESQEPLDETAYQAIRLIEETIEGYEK